MTTTGYGDLTPDRSHPAEIVSAMALMLAGTIITGPFIAFGASLLTRVHWVRMQGLRPGADISSFAVPAASAAR